MKKILQRPSSELDKEILKEIEQIKDDIDFLYSLIQPDPPDLISLDNYDYGITVKITEEIYNEIVKYLEKKDNLFIGIS